MIQDHKKVKFPGQDILSLAVKGLKKKSYFLFNGVSLNEHQLLSNEPKLDRIVHTGLTYWNPTKFS